MSQHFALRHPALAHMTRVSQETGLPHRFETDLTVHDAQVLSGRDPRQVFGWLLYEHGTHLTWAAPSTGRGEHPATLLRAMIADGDLPGVRCYIWSAGALREYAPVEWHDRMIALSYPEAVKS